MRIAVPDAKEGETGAQPERNSPRFARLANYLAIRAPDPQVRLLCVYFAEFPPARAKRRASRVPEGGTKTVTGSREREKERETTERGREIGEQAREKRDRRKRRRANERENPCKWRKIADFS